MHYIAYDPALFINGKRSVAESHTEGRKYLCRFHPCNEILKRLYEIFEKSKKQDLTPIKREQAALFSEEKNDSLFNGINQ